jgi:hypothetical protein
VAKIEGNGVLRGVRWQLLDVRSRRSEDLGVVPEVTQTAIALGTKEPSDAFPAGSATGTALVIVIHVEHERQVRAADSAAATLLLEQGVEALPREPVPTEALR